MNNQPFVQRMQEEYDQLYARTESLWLFMLGPIYQGLDEERKRLLRTQYTLMVGYRSVLADRINLELQ